MSNQENKQAKQDLPADSAEQPKPAPKPSPEKRPEKQAPPPPASKKVKNPKRVAAGKALAARNKEKLAKIKAFEESEPVKQEESKLADQPASVPAELPEATGGADWSLLFLVGGGVAFVGLSAAFGYQKWTSNAAPAPTTLAKPPAEPVKLAKATESS